MEVILGMHVLGESLLSAAWLQQKAMARKMHAQEAVFFFRLEDDAYTGKLEEVMFTTLYVVHQINQFVLYFLEGYADC